MFNKVNYATNDFHIILQPIHDIATFTLLLIKNTIIELNKIIDNERVSKLF